MPVALFQHSLDELDAGAVGDAVAEATTWLARADARMLVRRAYGVLVEGLTEPQARALAQALATRGIDVDRVSHDWLELPPVTACRRAALGPRGLVVYDVYGRSLELPWSRVLLVAVGSYMVQERAPVARKHYQPPRDAVRTLLGDGDADLGNYEYVDRAQVVLDIVVDLPARYRIQHQRFDYSYLGARRGPSASSNFPFLVRDLLEHVPHAVLTRGARALRSDAAETAVSYPGPTQYEREIAWSLWRFLGPGTRLDGGDPYRSPGAAGPRLTAPLTHSAPASPPRAAAKSSRSEPLTRPGAAPLAPPVPPVPPGTFADAGLAVLGGAAVAVAGWWLDPLAALLALPVVPVLFQRLHGRRRQPETPAGGATDGATPDRDPEAGPETSSGGPPEMPSGRREK
jgi:hypothetical protein